MKSAGQAVLTRTSKPRPKVHQVFSLPVPVGGLNTVAPLNAMPPTDCIQLINWIPTGYGLKMRQGWMEWTTGIDSGAPVQSILSYLGAPQAGPTKSDQPQATYMRNAELFGPRTPEPRGASFALRGKLFACTTHAIYDCTSQGLAPVSVQSLSGASNAGRFEGTMFATGGGSFLCVCSETDGYMYYNGTAWVKPTLGTGAGQVSGVDPANLVYVMAWKQRLLFIERNSTRMWIGGIGAITGPLTQFDFGPLFEHGGSLDVLATWTMDAGSGIDDFLVVISSEGDVLVYQGTDPTVVGAFALTGAWDIGRVPFGRRYFDQFGGDLVILSTRGLNPVSYITRGGTELLRAQEKNYTAKIQNSLHQALAGNIGISGWEVRFCASAGVLLIGAPPLSQNTYQQWALSLTTLGWTNFQGMPATCFWVAEDQIFFGTNDGRVALAFNSDADGIKLGQTAGAAMNGTLQTAFSYFDKPGAKKRFLMVRPTFLAAQRPGVNLQMNIDFLFTTTPGSPMYTDVKASLWDTAVWDANVWGGLLNTFQQWVGTTGVGYAGSLALNTVSTGELHLASLDYMVEGGGPL